jgi:ATP-dependent helicase/nuclease subunit A
MSSPSSGSTRTWTPEQSRAIHTIGTSLLVSAAAGSGKTSVLAERCVQLLCHPDEPCDVGELLVVTFTESAAAEMKSRIAKSLTDRHAQSPTATTERHLAMLDRASIGTLHSFCSRLLRQNFHLLGIDPDFRILDADEAALLKLDVARDLFDSRYEDPEDLAFRNLIDCYGDGCPA